MATMQSLEVARTIRAEIENRGTNIQQMATAAGLTPRTFREHLKIGSLTLDEIFAASRVLGVDASELIRRAEKSAEHRSSAA